MHDAYSSGEDMDILVCVVIIARQDPYHIIRLEVGA
jgi:hypothetical protein